MAFALVVADSTCTVFFALWDEANAEPLEKLGKITFASCWATATVTTEFLPHAVAPHTFTSHLLEVPASAWLAATALQRAQSYPAGQNRNKSTYHHYLVQGTGSYAEALATHFTAGLASPDECRQYAFLRE